MHLPDGFLDVRTWVSLDVVSAGAVGYALNRCKKLGGKQIPLLGVLAAILLGPSAGVLLVFFLAGALVRILRITSRRKGWES